MTLHQRFTRLLAMCASIFSFSIGGYAEDTVSDTLATIAKGGHPPGIVWATVTPEGIRTGAVGLRDVEDKIPYGADSRFLIGSVTKTLTATAILHLATEGKLDLDAPASSYMGGLTFDNPWRKSTPVTVRNLLDHASGLNGSFMWQYSTRDLTPDTPLKEAFTRHAGALRIRVRPGTAFSYSNQGYALQGLIIEQVSGERFEDYMEREILKPIGMTDSSFHFRTQANGRYHDPKLAYSYGPRGRVTTQPIMLRPAGMFSTTTADMAKYMQFLLGDGSAGGKQLISPALVAMRGHPTTTGSAKAGLNKGGGLGLFTQEVSGAEALCHDGAIEFFRTRMCLFPKDGKAFFLGVNGGMPYKTDQKITDTLVQTLSPTPVPLATPHALPADMKDWEGIYVPAPFRYQSTYFPSFLMVNRTVRVVGDKVALSAPGLKPRMLVSTGDHLFSAEGRRGNTHAFFRDENGNRILSSVGNTYRKVSPLYIYAPWASIGLALIGILWTVGAVLIRVIRGFKSLPEHPLFTPFLSLVVVLGTLIPALAQPVEVQTDVSLLHILLAAATLALPLSLLHALFRVFRTPERGKIMTVHGVMALLMLQFCLLLIYWGKIPLMSWTF